MIKNNYCGFGPSFGEHDLLILHNFCDYCIVHGYEKHIRETNDDFLVEEYELFQIIWT